jgi:hypothetical protein
MQRRHRFAVGLCHAENAPDPEPTVEDNLPVLIGDVQSEIVM